MGTARKHNHKRRHKTSRVTRKKNTRALQRADFRDASVASAWRADLTTQQNYEALGLVMNTNTAAEVAKHAPGVLAAALGVSVEWVDLPAAGDIAATLEAMDGGSKRPADWVSTDEAEYLDRCMAAHGSNYVAMARDIKRNYKQHSAEHLQHRCERLARFRDATTSAALSAAAAPSAAAHRDVDMTPVPAPVVTVASVASKLAGAAATAAAAAGAGASAGESGAGASKSTPARAPGSVKKKSTASKVAVKA